MSEPGSDPLQVYFGAYEVPEDQRELLMREFSDALDAARGQERLFALMVNILAVVGTVFLAVSLSDRGVDAVVVADPVSRLLLSAAVFIIGLIILVYFAEVQKTIVLNARKVVTIRRVLGLDYSPLRFSLPTWRVEGATNPFAIRIFPGWSSPASHPFWVIAVVVLGVGALLFSPLWSGTRFEQLLGSLTIGGIGIIFLALVFRRTLNEEHESWRLQGVYLLSRIMRCRLLPEFPYILFRAKLASEELRRLEVDTTVIQEILVAVEDCDFFEHRGYQVRALVRGLLSQFRLVRTWRGWSQGGGSSIPMQLARTLLIQDYAKRLRRKLLEPDLAVWLDEEFGKSEMLTMYLSAVQFSKGTRGLAAAITKYFGSPKGRKLTAEEAFFLVERLSARPGHIRVSKVLSQLEGVQERTSIRIDPAALREVYSSAVERGLLDSDDPTWRGSARRITARVSGSGAAGAAPPA